MGTNDEQDRRIAETVGWFKQQGVDLAFDQVGGAWVALMMPEGQRIGSAHAAHGDTKLEAAENARALREGQPRPGTVERSATGDITIHAPTARATAEAPPPTVMTSTDTATGNDHATVIKEAEQQAAKFGWRVGYAPEPDGSYTWIVFAEATGEPLQSGVADDWDDAKLASILNLQPPSGER
jgi:hypothetical protein